jgi:hypothetical protein
VPIKVKILFGSLWFLIAVTSYGQNLIPNYSFEIYDSCPIAYTPVDVATPWKQATTGTTDYFNACGSSGSGIPWNFAGYQSAMDGSAYCGLAMYADTPGTNYREYIQVKLLDTLVTDSCYQLTFYVALGNFIDNYRVTHFSALFSSSAVSTSNFYVLPYSPQFTCINSAGIGDTAGWEKITGIFLANGTEEYMTIGNFKNDALTTLLVYDSGAPNPGVAYYLVDSVSLVKVTCPANIGINEHEERFSAKVYPNPARDGFSLDLNISSEYSMSVADAYGSIFLTENFKGNSTRIASDTWANGVYFLKITDHKTELAIFNKLIVAH